MKGQIYYLHNHGSYKKTGSPFHRRSCPFPKHEGDTLSCNKSMITVLFKNCNHFSQDLYDQAIDRLQIHMIECSCGRKGCLIRYGHYKRSVKYMSGLILLSVQRVWCKECKTSHALLPSLLVPYSQIPLRDQQEILLCTLNGISPEMVMERNFLVDENHIKHILRRFKKHWKERLASLHISLLEHLTVPCLLSYSMQFLQIRRTRNKLCTLANIA